MNWELSRMSHYLQIDRHEAVVRRLISSEVVGQECSCCQKVVSYFQALHLLQLGLSFVV